MIKLRPYQQDIIDKTRASMVNGNKAPLIVAPCGAGKTVMFSYFTSQAVKKGKTVLILAHRQELLDQISETLNMFDVNHGFIAAGRPYLKRKSVYVGSVFSVVRRLSKLKKPDIIIVDEAHHCCSKTTWGKIIKYFNTWVIGVTATPCRLSGEGLDDVFDDMIMGPEVVDPIEIGSLCKYKYYAPTSIDLSGAKVRMGDYVKKDIEQIVDKPTITGNAIKEYKKILKDKRAVVFCVSIDHANNVAKQFREEGIPSACIDGNMPSYVRNKIVNDFRENKIKVLTNCNIVTEGFDLKELDGVILLRPTQSLSMYIQMVGRALRVSENKETAIILDHVNNCRTHGLPDEIRQWSLTGREKKKRGERDNGPPIKVCPSCFAAQPPTENCSFCGFKFESKPRKIDEVDGELSEVDVAQLKKDRRKEQGQLQTEEELVALGKKRGYKRPRLWARHIIRGRKR